VARDIKSVEDLGSQCSLARPRRGYGTSREIDCKAIGGYDG
jgi:hypothetical protein